MNPFQEGLKQYLNENELHMIRSAKIGIGGAGGLGSNVAIILTRTGFENFSIIDKDTIEASNLNRQQYFMDDIGSSKVETLRKHLLKINPDINCKVFNKKWTPDLQENILEDCTLIVEAFDGAEDKSRFVEYYQEKADFVISGNGMAGLIEKKPLGIKRIANVFIVGDNKTDTACGNPPLAPRVITCAAMMAEVVLDLTLGLKHTMY